MEASRRTGARLALVALAACGHQDPTPSAANAGTILAGWLAAADAAKAPWRCTASDLPALADEQLAGWHLAGHRMSRENDQLTIGVIADAAGSAPRTIAALGRLRARLDEAAPDLVLSLGGMGANEAELLATLGTLADHAKWPLVALPGDLEATSAHVAALAALRKRGAPVVDGRLVRWIETPAISIATLPGAGALERLVAGGDGCAWQRDEVAAIYRELTARSGVRVAATAEGLRTVIGGEPAGELGLVPPQPIEVALHGPLVALPTPAKSGGRDGASVPITPGTSDATTRLPAAHIASAGVLVIRGTSWSWRPLVDAK